MKDFFLRFPDQQTAKTHIYTIEYRQYIDEDGNEVLDETLTPRYRNMDIIGTIDSDQFTLGEPQEIDGYICQPDPVYIPLPGYHVNLRALDDEDTASLEQFVVHPARPRRVWA